MVLSYRSVRRAELDVLTRCEREVSSDLLNGLSYAAIAVVRGTSARTVANQVASIFRKLGVGSRHELAAVLAGQRFPQV